MEAHAQNPAEYVEWAEARIRELEGRLKDLERDNETLRNEIASHRFLLEER